MLMFGGLYERYRVQRGNCSSCSLIIILCSGMDLYENIFIIVLRRKLMNVIDIAEVICYNNTPWS
jgi:hypothetical protein